MVIARNDNFINVVCDLSQVKQKEGLTLTDNSANNTRNNGSFKARFTYGCEQDGKLKHCHKLSYITNVLFF